MLRMLVGWIGILLLAAPAWGVTELDLTTALSSGTLNNSLFYQFTSGGAGSGAVDDFVRFQKANSATTEGYNTDGSPFQYDEVGGSFTHSILLSDIPIMDIGGTSYREFAFDINEAGGNKTPLSLDEVQLYVAGSGSLLGHPTFGGSATLVYDLDAGGDGDSRVLLDMGLSGGGSGKLDMLMYIPDSLFTAVGTYGPDPNVYLYSKVGEKGGFWDNSDGFEGWVVSEDGGIGIPVPEPAGMLMLGAGLTGLLWIGGRRPRS